MGTARQFLEATQGWHAFVNGRLAPRIVLDTNVVLSALLFPSGKIRRIRHLWTAGIFVPLLSRETATELLRALAYPRFALERGDQEALLAEYIPWCDTVVIPRTPPRVPECRDHGDTPFLELAAAGEAVYIVTGDKDLLALNARFVCPIVTAKAFLDLVDTKPGVWQGKARYFHSTLPRQRRAPGW